MDLDSVADELYGLNPREFVAARNTRAKEAKAAGEAGLAGEISRLRKPTAVAWVANQLARRRAAEIGQLLDLGAELRKATTTLSGSKLRELSGQRRQVVQAMVQQARAVSRDAGAPVNETVARELEETLTAAMADASAAEALRQGRLAEGLQHTGFGTPGEATPPKAQREPQRAQRARSAGSSPKESAADRRRAQRREDLDRELGDAWATARQAADARAEADADAGSADKDAQSAQREVDRLRADLREAEQLLSRARDRRKKAVSARDAARRYAERATRRVSQLQAELENL